MHCKYRHAFEHIAQGLMLELSIAYMKNNLCLTEKRTEKSCKHKLACKGLRRNTIFRNKRLIFIYTQRLMHLVIDEIFD